MSLEAVEQPPLAGRCSLCGGGYHPNLAIDISDKPRENQNGEREFRWGHVMCQRDHDRTFIEFLESLNEDGP